MSYLQLNLLPFPALASRGWEACGRGGGMEHLCHTSPPPASSTQPLNPKLPTPSGGTQRQRMSGVTAQSDVAGAARVSVGVLWHFCGFHRNLPTWDPAITISRTGSSLSLSGSLHLQLIPTDSNPEPWAVCGPSSPHYLCWVHQPSKGTSGAKSL